MKVSKGTIFKKKNSPYLYINISINKKRYLINTKYPYSKEQYVKDIELPLFRAKILSKEIVLEKEETQVKNFEYYSKSFLNTKKYLKESTFKVYSISISFINSQFGSLDISEIKTSDIKSFLYSLDISALTFRNYLVLFKNIFDEALQDGLISVNPCDNIKRPKGKTKDIEPFSVDEVDLILNSCSGWFRNFLALSFYTGVRTGEAIALKWQNVDLKKKRIYINATKADYTKESTPKTSNRYVPIFDSLIPYLEEQKRTTGLKTYVFYSDRGKVLRSNNLKRYYWFPLLRRLNIAYRVIYNTRHTFATNMIISNQFNLNQIAYWLGHANIRMLIHHYNKYISSDLDNIDKSFDVFCVKKCNTNFVSA